MDIPSDSSLWYTIDEDGNIVQIPFNNEDEQNNTNNFTLPEDTQILADLITSHIEEKIENDGTTQIDVNILTELMLQGGSSTVDSSDDGIIGLMQITGISNPSQDLDNNTVNGDQQNLFNSVIVNATEIVSKIQDADITTEDIKEIVEDAFENTIEELNSYDPEIFNI